MARPVVSRQSFAGKFLGWLLEEDRKEKQEPTHKQETHRQPPTIRK